MVFSIPGGKVSAWKLDTYGSGGVSIGFVAAGGGQIDLIDPAGKKEIFTFGGIGVGLSAGLKIPKLGKVQIPTPKGPLTGAGGPKSFPTTGMVIAQPNLPGGDLTKSDIQGLCMFVEVGGGIIAGGSAMSMLVGLNPFYLPMLASSFGAVLFVQSAKGIILMAGVTVGIQAQVGGTSSIGYLR